ncbi:MAG: DUF4855 domain-containing protein [Bacteroidales bacterium]|jgi:hypothetical protein|nr:DUF4855 domain-containing protein [Bacteroidales bacterium]
MELMVKYAGWAAVMAWATLVFTGFVCCADRQSVDAKTASDVSGTETPEAEILPVTDMVLIYGGGKHRTATWNREHFAPYVSYTDRAQKEQWLFDGFLFLEITNGVSGKQRIFATGYYGQPAGKTEWERQADYYFTENNGVYALDDCIAAVTERLGAPAEKRKVVIGLPEPIVAGPGSHYAELPADYWGSVDGKQLDFTGNDDRITACKWFIDYVEARFNEGNFKHVELAGFYWIAEESLHTKTILAEVAACLNGKKYSFNWIPYWKTDPDYYDWQALKFNYAYLQPNYFFNDNTPYSRLTEACNVAKLYRLDMELEFDLSVFVGDRNRGSRLYDYMKAFRENGILTSKRIAYYQDCDALYQLYHAAAEQDKNLFHDFCAFVVEHQTKYQNE